MVRVTSSMYYMRVGMYILTIAMHGANVVYMTTKTMGKLPLTDDPYIMVYATLQTRFFTFWTLFLQIVYAVLALIGDILVLKNSSNKNYKLPKYLHLYRDSLFSSVLWPSCWVVFLFFWILYHYDRDLIYPPFVDNILTPVSNHVMHTFIIPIATWEVLFRPRQVPKSHLLNILYLTIHLVMYLLVMSYTYVETGIWIYPIFGALYGIHFIFSLVVILLIALGAYFIQWPITRTLFQETRKKVK